jgi:hypothetical protein
MFLRYQHSNYAGDFRSRLKAFNLDQYFDCYPLLVKYDWLCPAFHVPVPESSFRNWKDYPLYPAELTDSSPHWAYEFDGRWYISEGEIGTDEWFVHPLLRKGPSRSRFFDHAAVSHADYSWEVMQHSEGRKFVPAFDYFYEWQIFRFADVVHWMRGDHPHFWQPGAHDNFLKRAQETSPKDFDRAAIAPGWSTRATAFTWLAHFIAYDRAFESYTDRFVAAHKDAEAASHDALNKKLNNEKKLGAVQLMSWMGITSTMLEASLKDEFLTLAQRWRAREYHQTAETRPLWRALQTQVRAAVSWLCAVNNNDPIDYLDRLRYDHIGQDVWAQLEDVLEYPLWKAARKVSPYISQLAHNYSKDHGGFASDFAPSPRQLVNLGARVEGFDDYLDALWRLILESEHRDGDDPFRPRSRSSWYRVIAIIGFMMLEDAVGKHERKFPMKAVAEKLADKGYEWASFYKRQRSESPEKTLAKIADGIRNATTKDDLILYFCLAVHYARNSTAHPYGAKHDWLNADWAGPIFDALVLFVPCALMQLKAHEQTESQKLVMPIKGSRDQPQFD